MLAILRIVAGLVFVSAGTAIVFHFPPGPAPVPPFDPTTELGIAGILEIVGGLAVALGLFTRPVAFVLSGQMAVAYFQVHFPQSVFPTANGGMPAVLFCFIFLYLSVAGPGAWSLDARLARRRARARARPDLCADCVPQAR